jgi:hypothetical protein
MWQSTELSFWKLSALPSLALSSLNCVLVLLRRYDCLCFCMSVCVYVSVFVSMRPYMRQYVHHGIHVCVSKALYQSPSLPAWLPRVREARRVEKDRSRGVVGMPGGSSSDSVWPRPDQQLSTVAMQSKGRGARERLQPLQDGKPVYWGGVGMRTLQRWKYSYCCHDDVSPEIGGKVIFFCKSVVCRRHQYWGICNR